MLDLKNFAKTPKTNYYAAIFTSQKSNQYNEDYDKMSIRMDELAKQQSGYLGHESVRNSDGFGITISYWETLDDIKKWKSNSEHMAVQEFGIKDWYDHYEVRVSEVKYSYSKKFNK